MLEATLLEDVSSNQDVVRQEAFGPVAVLSKFDDFDAALDQVNDSVFGLQAGIFTRDLYKAHAAWDRLDCGWSCDWGCAFMARRPYALRRRQGKRTRSRRGEVRHRGHDRNPPYTGDSNARRLSAFRAMFDVRVAQVREP